MITESDLQEAIAECLGQRSPNASTCIKLAAFYTIKNELFGNADKMVVPTPAYSYAAPPDHVENRIEYESDTEFGKMVYGRRPSEVWPVIDELVSEALAVVNPRLYASFIRRLQ